MRVVHQTIHRGVGEQLVVEQWRPFFERAVRGDHGGGSLVALTDDVVEVDGLVVGECPQAEIVNDQQVDAGIPRQPSLMGTVGSTGAEVLEHLVRGCVQDVEAGKACPVPNSLSDVALAHAGLADDALTSLEVVCRHSCQRRRIR